METKTENIVLEDIREIREHILYRTYEIFMGDKYFEIEEKIWWDDIQSKADYKVVESEGSKEEEKKVIDWLENNYAEINN